MTYNIDSMMETKMVEDAQRGGFYTFRKGADKVDEPKIDDTKADETKVDAAVDDTKADTAPSESSSVEEELQSVLAQIDPAEALEVLKIYLDFKSNGGAGGEKL